ncbi:hypothetical protein [Haloarchaeobius baliensis]|uniref:hypothetical protein n=1 Tax=Haloarchaeobius baliensis TaxID=1670458 RepID=UPI003F8857C6
MLDVVGWFTSLPRWQAVAVTAAAVGVLVGLFMLRSLPRVATWWPQSVRSVAVGERVTVTGTVEPADGTTTSPITNDRCLVYRNDVRSRRNNPYDELDDRKTREDFEDRYRHSVAFDLDDDTGHIRVDPDGMGLYGEPIDTGDGDLAAAKQFASNRQGSFLQNPDMKHEDVSFRLTARQLEPGDTATVTGIVAERDSEPVLVANDGLVGFTGSVVTGTRAGYLTYLFRRAVIWCLGAAAAVFLVEILLSATG